MGRGVLTLVGANQSKQAKPAKAKRTILATPILRPFALCVFWCALLAFRGFLRCCLILLGYKTLKVNRCRFFGPSSFIEVCHKAAEELRRLDADIFDQCTRKKIWFVSHRDPRLHYLPANLCGISNETLSWGPSGVILYMVSMAHQTAPEVVRARFSGDLAFAAEASSLAQSRTEFWLAMHDFPNELIELFN